MHKGRTYPIAQGQSRPCDANARSFLDLPSEIRNQIYDLLCKQEAPVYLHDADLCEPERPFPSPWPEMYSTEYAWDQAREYVAFKGVHLREKQIFRHGFGPAKVLLSTCREVYHECAPLLYSENDFVITRSSFRCDEGSSKGEELQYSGDYHQVSFAPRWLRSIGANIHALRKVIIDADTMCPTSCRTYTQELQLLPLISLLWQHPRLRDIVSIAHSGRKNRMHRDYRYRIGSSAPLVSPAREIDLVLDFFHSHEMSGYRCWSNQGRLLDKIYLIRCFERFKGPHYNRFDGVRGVEGYTRLKIVWYGTRYGLNKTETFTIGRDTIGDKSHAPEKSCQYLPLEAVARTGDYLEPNANPHEIILDLGRKTGYGLRLELGALIERYSDWDTYKSELKQVVMRTHTVDTSFDFGLIPSFVELKKGSMRHLAYQQSPASRLYPTLEAVLASSKSWRWPPDALVIELSFTPDRHTEISDIRINVKHLLPALSSWCDIRKKTLSIQVACPDHIDGCSNPVLVDISVIRKQVFFLLVSLIKTWPDDLDVRAANDLPDIWLNGHGEAVSAGYYSEDGIPLNCTPKETQFPSEDECFYVGFSLTEELRDGDRFGCNEHGLMWEAFDIANKYWSLPDRPYYPPEREYW